MLRASNAFLRPRGSHVVHALPQACTGCTRIVMMPDGGLRSDIAAWRGWPFLLSRLMPQGPYDRLVVR